MREGKSVCKMFDDCLIKAVTYVTTDMKRFCIAYFSKFRWEGFFFKMCKNSHFHINSIQECIKIDLELGAQCF